MGKQECNLVTVAKGDKKSLLEKYDIPVEHLSYEYISDCKNSKYLERIVLILRSGEEGVYPDLTRHAEEHLQALKPNSRLLRTACPLLKRNAIGSKEQQEIESEIENWFQEMQNREKDLEEGKMFKNKIDPYPEIRKTRNLNKRETQVSCKRHDNSKRITSCDYAAWDKYDADTEADRIDLQEEQEKSQAKRTQQRQREMEEKNLQKISKEALIDKLTLTATELSYMAEQEREKGNEAFKAGDYHEALQFYNTCIAMDPNVNSYNNRAITNIKLGRFNEAVNDCNKVLSMEHTNAKALLRRAGALEHLEKKNRALEDYESVLQLEPMNKIAIAAVNKLRKPVTSKNIRMKIEEYNDPETSLN